MADATIKALHNAARRYCITRLDAEQARHFAWLREQIGERIEWRYHEVALRNFQAVALNDFTQVLETPEERIPRLVNAILVDIERTVPDDFRSATEARDYLLAVGQRATIRDRQVSWGWGEVKVQDKEPDWSEDQRAGLERTRTAYLMYIAGLTAEQAAQVKPVPYRQVMSASKRRRIWKHLAQRWDVDPLSHYWYPLWGDERPPDVLALQEFYFYKEVGVRTLQEILRHRGITRLWELNEQRLDPEYELDPRLCRFEAGVEMYWSSGELDWLVYISHESSITFAGGWLVEAVKEVWPTWQERVYTDWNYEH